MITEQKGNLLTSGADVICHQTNCKGVMGAGIAKEIANTWSIVKEYNQIHLRVYDDNTRGALGTICAVPLPREKQTDRPSIVINMYAQNRYGRDGRYTEYDAFESCLNKIEDFMRETKLFDTNIFDREKPIVGFPKFIGCGLAGGEWSVIEPMIYKFAYNIQDVCDVQVVEFSKEKVNDNENRQIDLDNDYER